MDKISQDAIEIAEKICQRKFEEHFNTKLGEKKVYIEKSQMDIYREQMIMWDELGKTHLTQKEIQNEPPIKQALWFKCRQKRQWCLEKLIKF